jgi:hypothetical protein
MLKNPYTRVAIAAALGTLVGPTITRKLTIVEMSAVDGIQNDIAYYGVSGAAAAFIFVLLSMTIGPPAAAA